MKKILLILLLTIFFVPKVNAEEYNSCFDEYKIATNLKFTFLSNYQSRMLVNLPLVQDKTYYLKFWNLDSSHSYRIFSGPGHYAYDSSDNLVKSNFTFSDYGKISIFLEDGLFTYTYTGGLGDVSYFHLAFYVYEIGNYYVPNSDAILTLSDHELITCPEPDPEPDPEPELPVEPEDPVVPVPTDTTLDTFYSIYLDKLSTATTYATENKFLLGFIGIILSFIILELVLKLVRNGGYH